MAPYVQFLNPFFVGFFTIAHADSDSSYFGLIIGVMFAVNIALTVTVILVVLRKMRRKRRNRTEFMEVSQI